MAFSRNVLSEKVKRRFARSASIVATSSASASLNSGIPPDTKFVRSVFSRRSRFVRSAERSPAGAASADPSRSASGSSHLRSESPRPKCGIPDRKPERRGTLRRFGFRRRVRFRSLLIRRLHHVSSRPPSASLRGMERRVRDQLRHLEAAVAEQRHQVHDHRNAACRNNRIAFEAVHTHERQTLSGRPRHSKWRNRLMSSFSKSVLQPASRSPPASQCRQSCPERPSAQSVAIARITMIVARIFT